MTYTISAVLGVVVAVVIDLVVFRSRLLTTRGFWAAYVIIVFFQLVTNGVLTGLEVVRYRADTILGPRVVFAPVEDLLFGFALVLCTLSLWVWFGTRRAAVGRATGVEEVHR